MRLIPILTALIVVAASFLMVFKREAVLEFARGGAPAENAQQTAGASDGQGAEDTASGAQAVAAVSVVALKSQAQEIDSAVALRGSTQASRQVELRAETSGQVISEPLRKGAFVEAGEVLCRLDPGTREVSLAEAKARFAEALSRVPEAEARVAEAESNVPAVEAALAEAQVRIPAAEAGLNEARAGLPAAEAMVAEARARLAEAEINYNAAVKLSESGYASDTRVANAQAMLEAARSGVQAALSQLEGAAARVISAEATLEGARAGVKSAESRIEGARASVQSAMSGVENAKAGVQSAEAGIAAAEREIERLTISAPFAGHLESDTAELGTLLQPGGLCATVLQLDPIKLVGFVAETQVNRVQPGALAGARLASGEELIGTVTFLARSADPMTRTFRVEIAVANPALAVRDGQTADILIQSEGRLAHLVPQSALTLDDTGTLGVRVVAEGNVAGFVPVTMLRDTPQGIWVSGLGERAEVIVVGQGYVADGVPLAVTYREPDA
jgi:multidrug efflux system membrane fusion protein